MGDLPERYEGVVWVRCKETGAVELARKGREGKDRLWFSQTGFDGWANAEDYEVLAPLEGPETESSRRTDYTDLDELREKAKQATGGPWTAEGPYVAGKTNDGRPTEVIIQCRPTREGISVPNTHNAQFVAATDPVTVLSIIERIERYEDAMERMAKATGNPAVERIRKEAMEGKDRDE